ncbi:MAG: hypothetical protein AB4290_11615 [Spirulina sp.]
MPLAELMSQIQTLPKLDKLRLMQFLVTELIKEEDANVFVANQEYPVWSPYNCSEAANVLMNLLATKQRSQDG